MLLLAILTTAASCLLPPVSWIFLTDRALSFFCHSMKILIRVKCLVFMALMQATPSLAGGGDGSSQSVNTTNIIPTEINGVGQPFGGIIQVNNGSSNTSAGCGGGCAYLNIRAAPTTNGINTGTGLEGSAGVVWQFGSAEAAQSQAIRLASELQKYKTEQEIIDYLSRQLAEALESNRLDRARIIAITLAPKLGYSDYRLLLRTVTSGRVQG